VQIEHGNAPKSPNAARQGLRNGHKGGAESSPSAPQRNGSPKSVNRSGRAQKEKTTSTINQSKSAFPSARQAACAGLRRQFYPDHLRDLVDYDYAEALPEEARVFLAAFTEEHYRGFRLKRETQVTTLEHLREADAARKRVVRGEDVLAFGKHVDRLVTVHGKAPGEAGHSFRALRSPQHLGGRVSVAAALVAGSSGLQVHELAATNYAEDRMVDELDEQRAAMSAASIRGKR
jgi:hypothetical protein